MIGYHYTDGRNLDSIRCGGLVPYRLKDDIAVALADPHGVYIFTEPTVDGSDDEVGCVLFQAIQKRTLHVVCLAVEYGPDDVAPKQSDGPWRLHHTGDLNGWPYHVDRPFDVLLSAPPERVTVHREYDARPLVMSP